MTAPTSCRKKCDTTLKTLIVKPRRAFINTNWIRNECGHNQKIRGDVAIIELGEDILFSNTVQPACVYTKRVEENSTLTIYGYGMTEYVTRPAKYKQI